MNQISLSENLKISKLVHGHWRLAEWNYSNQELLALTEQLIELGITSFDHADIYGDYACEKLFGNALCLKKDLRKNIQIITKCGIKLISKKFPSTTINHYNYGFEHITKSVDNSLKNFNTDYIDLLLLHRPAPFFNPEEVTKAIDYLKQSGKVLNFGVSNFTPMQFDMLASYTNEKLVTNQVEISPNCLEHFENENVDFFLKNRIKPMAWSPLAGGELLNPQSDKAKRVNKTLVEVGEELNITEIDQVIYSWLLSHPVSIIPIVGSGKIARIKSAINALDIHMTLEQWYKIYIAAKGEALP